jgi:uncharacterized membrane protein
MAQQPQPPAPSEFDDPIGAAVPGIDPDDRRQVEQAIAAAEAQTGAEFVVAIAARSGRYDRAEDLFGLLTGLLAVAAAWLIWQDIGPDTRDWSTGWSLRLGLPIVLGLFAFWTILGAMLATRFPPLARPFLRRGEMDSEVRRRGREAFHMFRVDRSSDGDASPGVLIYISLLERMVYIAATPGLEQQLPPEILPRIRDAMIADIRARKRPGETLAAAVQSCAAAIAPFAPARAGRANALTNTVRLLT